MKTKLFIAAALLFTGTAFSQSVSSRNEASSHASASTSSTASKASAGGSLSSSSSATGRVNAASRAESASKATSEVKQSGEARLTATKNDVRKDYEQVSQETEAKERISAGAYAGSNGNVEAQHNKGGSNASINTAKGVSATSTLGSETVNVTKADVTTRNAAAMSMKTGDGMKAKANAAGAHSQVNTRSKVSVNGGVKQTGTRTGIKSHIATRTTLSIK